MLRDQEDEGQEDEGERKKGRGRECRRIREKGKDCKWRYECELCKMKKGR